MKKRITEFIEKYWLGISLGLLSIGATSLWFILRAIFCAYSQIDCEEFVKSIPTAIEISIGIGVAIIVHNHTRKIQSKENEDLSLTIQGVYFYLWNLHMALLPYFKSDKVRADKIVSLQILNLVDHIQGDLSRCARKINSEKIKELQLHLILLQKSVNNSLDPRSNIEALWNTNVKNSTIAFNQITTLSLKYFEEFVPKERRMEWTDLT